MIKVKLVIKGDKELIKKLRKSQTDFDDWKPTMVKIGDFLRSFYANQVFSSEGSIIGMQWPRLSPFYDFWKRNTFGGVGMLVVSGRLKGSFTSEATRSSVEVDNPTPYAIYHQFGTRRMPQRVMMHADNRLEKQIVDIFKEGVEDKLRKIFA